MPLYENNRNYSQQFSWCFYSMLYKFDFLYFANSVMPWFIAFLRRQYWRRRQATELWLKMAGIIPAYIVSPRLNFVQINFVMCQKLPVDTLESYRKRSLYMFKSLYNWKINTKVDGWPTAFEVKWWIWLGLKALSGIAKIWWRKLWWEIFVCSCWMEFS